MLDSPRWIITARGLAGLGAALVMPATLSVITAGFPDERRARAVGVWAGTAGAGCIAGMLVSGMILEYGSWIMIFVSFAVAAAVLLVASPTIASSRAREQLPPDLAGSALSVLAVGLFVFGLMEGPHRGWTDATVLACIVLGLAAATGFVLTELRTPAPLLDVRSFTDRAFGSGAPTLLFQFVAMFGVFFIVVQYLQLVLGYSPLGSSLQLIPLILLVMTVSVLIPPLVPRVGLRFLFTGGLALLTGAFVLIGELDPQSSTLLINVALLLPGIGLGTVSAPATHAIVSRHARRQAGRGVRGQRRHPRTRRGDRCRGRSVPLAGPAPRLEGPRTDLIPVRGPDVSARRRPCRRTCTVRRREHRASRRRRAGRILPIRSCRTRDR